MPRVSSALLAALVLSFPLLAHAGQVGVVVASAPPAVDGGLLAGAQSALGDAHERGTAIQLAPDQLTRLRDCVHRHVRAACADALGAAPAHDHWLLLDVAQDAPDQPLVINGWWLSGEGELLMAEQRYCDHCDATRGERVTAQLVAYLLDHTRDGAVRTMLRVHTQPAGAVVAVDGQEVGVSSLDYAVFPGRHRVRAALDGHRIEEREIDVAEGATLEVNLELRPDDGPGADTPAVYGGHRALGWSLVGSGVALVAGGAALVAMDKPAIEDGHRNLHPRNSAPFGYGVGGVGLVAAAVGLYFVFSAGGDHAAPLALVPHGDGADLWARFDF